MADFKDLNSQNQSALDKVLIVAVQETNLTKNRGYNFDRDLAELENLILALGDMEIVSKIVQNMPEINKHSYIGSGKIEEVRMLVDAYEIDTIVTNDELSPSMITTLEDALSVRVLDRTYIILEIFRKRARTKEAKMQVEIASLKYTLPRLVGLRTGLSRQRGGKNKGKGEKQLELDHRLIENKINYLEHELKKLSENRRTQRKQRLENDTFTIALVGYTNSGKSSTLNALIKQKGQNEETTKSVFEKDMLFATLETSTRQIRLSCGIKILAIDTVGFINKLPHSLIESFKSTLEEVKDASLLVEVVDASDEEYMNQIEVCDKVISEIGAGDIPTLYAFNKIDKLGGDFLIPFGFGGKFENAICYSAKDEELVGKLKKKIEDIMLDEFLETYFKISYNKTSLVQMIEENGKVLEKEYKDEIIIHAKVSKYLYNYLKKYTK